MNYYNEFNPESAAMLRQMMADGLIPRGHVDERSITEVKPCDLQEYAQCHFFAGIGGWSEALRLADWPPARPVWTGSCPCQPFSVTGRHEGKEDDRHLWPVWERLIIECKPSVVFGEQVSNAIAHGWLDDIYQGLEPQGYAIGAAVLPACCVGSPHKRDRLWFVAHSKKTDGEFPMAWPKSESRTRSSDISGDVDNSFQSRLEGQPRNDCTTQGRKEQERSTAPSGFWDGGQWVNSPDGKTRLIEPSIPLVVNGVPNRRPILHAIGNAIVPQVAAEFIKATM